MGNNEEHNKNISDTLKYSVEQFDKSIVFIASGALGISFAFIKDIIPDLKKAVNKEYLIASWYFFASAIFFALFTHFVSMKACQWAIKNQNLSDTDFNEKIKNWNYPIMSMNILMIIFTLIGAIIFILFVNNNLFQL